MCMKGWMISLYYRNRPRSLFPWKLGMLYSETLLFEAPYLGWILRLLLSVSGLGLPGKNRMVHSNEYDFMQQSVWQSVISENDILSKKAAVIQRGDYHVILYICSVSLGKTLFLIDFAFGFVPVFPALWMARQITSSVWSIYGCIS